MRSIRLSTGPKRLFVAMFVVAMLVFLPMRLVLGWVGLGEQGLTARRVTGVVWTGGLREARFGEVALGDLHASLGVLPLITGRARVDLSGFDGAGQPALTGAITISRHSFGLDDANASISVGAAFGPLPVTSLALEDVSVRFVDGQCDSAQGRVRATLTGDYGGIPIPTALAGAARCDGGAVLLPLTSAAAGEGIDMRIFADGRYRTELVIQVQDPQLGQGIEAAGFARTDRGYALAIEGRF